MALFATSEERKEERLSNYDGYEVSENVYNLVLGGTISYGLWLNVAMVYLLSPYMSRVDPMLFIIGYFVSAFLGVFLAHHSDSAIVSFIGYNLVVIPIGALLAICMPEYPIESIQHASTLTGIISSVMMVTATLKPHLFENLGFPLGMGLLFGFFAEIISRFFWYSGDIFDWFFVILFSLYVGFDWWKAQEYPKTINNAVDCALDLYLDVVNLFIRILSLSSKRSD